MKKISLAFVVALIAYVASCSLPDPGCDDHSCDEKCLPLNKRHVKSMEMHVQVKCAYDSICLANIFFGLVKEMGWYSVDCYDKYEYTFVNESLKAKAVFGETISKVPLKEDHLRFSLFDEDDVEKKYDIDLSEIVHSYKYVGDSIAIKMPETLTEFLIECPYCTFATRYEEKCKGYMACVGYEEFRNTTMTIGVDSSWGKAYIMYATFDYPTAYGSDIIEVHAEVELRE
ncbi:MAG: hypothetical protein MJY82_01200 [Fibrobacter sp.]|nr:hypothetical protein [Fibrobacter sp.]